MKPITIDPKNAAAIEEVLHAVNGRSTAHAFTRFSELEELARQAELELAELHIAASRRAGAVFWATSGERVSNSYARKSSTRNGTKVRLIRRSRGWAIDYAVPETIHQEGGSTRLFVTPAQRDEAVAALTTRFAVLREY